MNEAGAGDTGVVVGENVDFVVFDGVDSGEFFPLIGRFGSLGCFGGEFDDEVGVKPEHGFAREGGEGEFALKHILSSGDFEEFIMNARGAEGLDDFGVAGSKSEQHAWGRGMLIARTKLVDARFQALDEFGGLIFRATGIADTPDGFENVGDEVGSGFERGNA